MKAGQCVGKVILMNSFFLVFNRTPFGSFSFCIFFNQLVTNARMQAQCKLVFLQNYSNYSISPVALRLHVVRHRLSFVHLQFSRSLKALLLVSFIFRASSILPVNLPTPFGFCVFSPTDA